MWRRARHYDDIFGYESGGSNSLSQNKLRKAHDDDRDRSGIAICNYKCRICKKSVRKSEFHIHEVESSKGIRIRKDNGKGKDKKTIPPDEPTEITRFTPIKITKKIESFIEAASLLCDEINSSEALANNPCLSCSFECFCIEEKRYLTCERIENWIFSCSSNNSHPIVAC